MPVNRAFSCRSLAVPCCSKNTAVLHRLLGIFVRIDSLIHRSIIGVYVLQNQAPETKVSGA